MVFVNRQDAGRQLGARLQHLRGESTVVLGLPRGGVPVASEVALALGAPLDVILVRKLGAPHQPELAMGAIGEDGVRVVNTDLMQRLGVTQHALARVEERERAELLRRQDRFRAQRRRQSLVGRIAVIVDDGIATGSTARAACEVARAHGARRVVLAVPVAPVEWAERLGDAADEYVCLSTPERFDSVGQWYADFTQTTDEEVLACLERTEPSAGSDAVAVEIPSGAARLKGLMTVPAQPKGVVVFAHGSGSSRHSARNQSVAHALNDVGLATLLYDLLTPEEECDRRNVFDIARLALRLRDATRWLRRQASVRGLPIGYFGASTGAAAALWAAAEPDAGIDAIVSRGGRPDLAESRLGRVTAPTLLIVGGDDRVVLALNRRAHGMLPATTRLEVVPCAGHLFEEPGALQQVAELAGRWFLRHFADAARRRTFASTATHLAAGC